MESDEIIWKPDDVRSGERARVAVATYNSDCPTCGEIMAVGDDIYLDQLYDVYVCAECAPPELEEGEDPCGCFPSGARWGKVERCPWCADVLVLEEGSCSSCGRPPT